MRKRKVGIGVTADPEAKALGGECESLEEQGGWGDS